MAEATNTDVMEYLKKFEETTKCSITTIYEDLQLIKAKISELCNVTTFQDNHPCNKETKGDLKALKEYVEMTYGNLLQTQVDKETQDIAYSKRRAIIKTWNRKLHERTQAYYHALRTKCTAEIYHDYLECEIPFIPRKFMEKGSTNDSIEETIEFSMTQMEKECEKLSAEHLKYVELISKTDNVISQIIKTCDPKIH